MTPSVNELGLMCHSAGRGRVWSSGCRVSEQLVQNVYLFSSYFWDRLWRNFDHACDVTSSILVK